MKKIYMNDIESLANCMSELADVVGITSVGTICKYNTAKILISELISHGYILEFVELSSADWDGYDKEFCVSIFQGEEITCEKIWNSNKDDYITCGADIMFVHDKCNSKIINKISSDIVYELELDCDCDCKECEHYEDDFEYDDAELHYELTDEPKEGVCIDDDYADEDDELPGFTKSWHTNDNGVFSSHSYSFYSSDGDMVKRAKNSFYDKFGF